MRYAIDKALRNVSIDIESIPNNLFVNGMSATLIFEWVIITKKSENPKITDKAEMTQLPMLSHSSICILCMMNKFRIICG